MYKNVLLSGKILYFTFTIHLAATEITATYTGVPESKGRHDLSVYHCVFRILGYYYGLNP